MIQRVVLDHLGVLSLYDTLTVHAVNLTNPLIGSVYNTITLAPVSKQWGMRDAWMESLMPLRITREIPSERYVLAKALLIAEMLPQDLPHAVQSFLQEVKSMWR